MNIIKELRKRAGLQQKDLAAAIGVSVATVSDWETQKKDPTGERLHKLAEYFKVDELVVLGVMAPGGDAKESKEYPKTIEARIVSFGMDQLPQDEREKILSVLQAMYVNNPNLFKRESDE